MLGSAAGGGLPQWNCHCPNCRLARDHHIAPQLQSSIAVSGEGNKWWLINASPDLPAQIEKFPPLQPNGSAVHHSARTTPIAGVLLSNADMDHALGMLLMRQREQPLPIYASDEVRNRLYWLDQLMQPFCGVEWRGVPTRFSSLQEGIEFRAHDLVRSVAFELRSRSGRCLVVAPSVSTITGDLFDAMKTADAIFFDGTFWSNDELRAFRSGAKSALEMGHMPVEESLPVLAESPARRKIYIHINNTNPILTPGAQQRRLVEGAGAIVGYDGLDFEI